MVMGYELYIDRVLEDASKLVDYPDEKRNKYAGRLARLLQRANTDYESELEYPPIAGEDGAVDLG